MRELLKKLILEDYFNFYKKLLFSKLVVIERVFKLSFSSPYLLKNLFKLTLVKWLKWNTAKEQHPPSLYLDISQVFPQKCQSFSHYNNFREAYVK